jgi:vacuolar protein sorting-associated protein 13A/C
VSHQLTAEIKIEHNIKVITFRSSLNVENQTSLPVEMIVVDAHGKASSGAMKIGMLALPTGHLNPLINA